MQKFVKLNKNNGTNVIEEQTSSLHPSQVKLVGYLKKKRTKVGGWRKMWFVLQNQLLLSYPSKEDYDRKLVSFKDVLNLVPGTVVRPLGGYRFAIQTTSESVFIFRCDDNKTYMEWITALVDSLSIGSNVAKKINTYGEPMVKKPLQGSHSCSSLVRSKKNKAVQIPIVHGTARILNRTGLSENDLRAFSLRDNNEKSNHFRLHETQLHLQNQSNEISRINRMFCGDASSDADASLTLNTTIAGTGSSDERLTRSNSKLSGLKVFQCENESISNAVNHKSVVNSKMHELLNFIKTNNFTLIDDSEGESDFARDINSNTRYDLKRFLDNERRNLDEDIEANIERNTQIEDQVQRLSLQGSSALRIDANKKVSLDEEVNCLRLKSIIQTEERIPVLSHYETQEPGCSSSSGSCSSSGRTNEHEISEIKENMGKSNEPIYAVVDLKNKYEHRARIRNEMKEKRQSLLGHMKVLDEATIDYEEIFDFTSEHFEENVENGGHCYDEENIYEPINIPEPSLNNHKHRNVLWKYISRLHIDALFELARNRKKTVKPTEHSSPFANIRQKIGHHRKSLRIRMIKLYARENPTTEDIVEKSDLSDKLDQDQT